MPTLFFIVSGFMLYDGGLQKLPVVLFFWTPCFLLGMVIQGFAIVAVEFYEGVFILKSILRKHKIQGRDITSVSEKATWLTGGRGRKSIIEICTAHKRYRIPITVDPSGEFVQRLKQSL